MTPDLGLSSLIVVRVALMEIVAVPGGSERRTSLRGTGLRKVELILISILSSNLPQSFHRTLHGGVVLLHG